MKHLKLRCERRRYAYALSFSFIMFMFMLLIRNKSRDSVIRMHCSAELLKLTVIDTVIIIFLFRIFLLIPCGRLSWIPVSFLLHVKYTLPYRIVSFSTTTKFVCDSDVDEQLDKCVEYRCVDVSMKNYFREKFAICPSLQPRGICSRAVFDHVAGVVVADTT